MGGRFVRTGGRFHENMQLRQELSTLVYNPNRERS